MTTPLEALADLGALIATVASPNLAYTGSPPHLARAVDPWAVAHASGAQIALFQTKFNAVTTAIGSGYPAALDTLGTLLASVTDNQNGGGHCLTYSTSTHLLTDATHAYNWGPSGSEFAGIISGFNALATVLGAGTTPKGIIFGGQSFAANWCGAASSPTFYSMRHSGLQRQINPSSGLINPMSVPMLADGVLDNFLPQMADLLLDDLSGVDLVTSTIAMGGTTFSQFAKGGTYNGQIGAMLGYYAANNIPLKAVGWAQGESDASNATSAGGVTSAVLSIIESFRYHGYSGPIFFDLETVSNSPNNSASYATNAAVRAGVTAAMALANNVYVGPDIDSVLVLANRYDNIHPNYAGETAIATAWKTAIESVL